MSEDGCHLPSHSESNVSNTDTAVDEQDGETGKGEEPVENSTTIRSQIDESKATEQELDDNNGHRTTLLVDICEQFRSHTFRDVSTCNLLRNNVLTICGQSLNRSSRAKSAGIRNTHDGNQDDCVENGRQSLDTGELNGNDEWRVS